MHTTQGSVVAVSSLKEFFRDAFHAAALNQRLRIDENVEAYVVSLLTLFSRVEALYERTPEGPRLRPLALMLADAVDAPTPVARQQALQRLGDVSLFIAGFFMRSFARKLVDVDYHIAMGGNAYGCLADTLRQSSRGRAAAEVYAQLAREFQGLVDVLNEVSEMSYQHSDADVLRLYEVWLKTGSRRAHALLGKLGVQPVRSAGARREH